MPASDSPAADSAPQALTWPVADTGERCDWDVVVIGGGAAGLIAAEQAAVRGKRTLLLEKNRRPGVKILMSGGTRCNLTHSTDKWGIIKAYGDQGSFLHSALALLAPADLVKLVEAEGIATKVEETGKVFPVSNKATDILLAFTQRLSRSSAVLATIEPVQTIARHGTGFALQTSVRNLTCEKLVITTGGLSYPGSGTTGDGYHWATSLGHSLVPTRPALVPITSEVAWVRELSGLTMPDVFLQVVYRPGMEPAPSPEKKKSKARNLAERRGSLLFTHFGLSGPVVLDVSRAVTAESTPSKLEILCDFLPDIRADQLDEQLRAELAIDGKRQVVGGLARFVPRRLAEQIQQLLELPPELRGAELSKKDRARMVEGIKVCRIPVSGTRGYAKAEVTAGGIPLKEVDSRTMESKLVPGLFFAGEVLDLDGPIGGFNFQAAFSTGMLAGQSV